MKHRYILQINDFKKTNYTNRHKSRAERNFVGLTLPVKLIVAMALSFIAASAVLAQDSPSSINIVPRPLSVRPSSESFILSDSTRLVAVDPESRRIASLFNDFLLSQHGVRLRFAPNSSRGGNLIIFSRQRNSRLPPEGYHLFIGQKSIHLSGEPAGLFYGMQTLTQLLPSGAYRSAILPGLEITDYPRFGYRGVLLDVGRHFFTVTYVKKYLDLLAQYKINTFHWHLTDDQGWRVEIQKYPKLTDTGSRPSQFLKGKDAESYPTDEPPYGGFYTQEQIKDVVAYASARFITIIPEIEMPGHSYAAVAAYPELACSYTRTETGRTSEAPGNIFCPKPATFTFLENVLTEIIALFPGPYIHIGGDEVPKEQWKQSREAQAIIAREKLINEDELQSFFVRHMEKFLNSKGKRMIGWDEILDGGVPANAIVMSWRGENGGIQAAQQQHQVIMSPVDYCYLDYNQGDPQREPANIGGYLPLTKVYSYDPISKELIPDRQKYILGVQGNVWTEYISTQDHLEYMVFPRVLALSEVAWSSRENKNYADFQRRLPYHLQRLSAQGTNYRIPEPDGLKDFYTAIQEQVRVALRPISPLSRIYYTLDGSTPTDQSMRYESPFEVTLRENEKVALNLIVVSPEGRSSIVYGAHYLRRPYLAAVAYDARQPGLIYSIFDRNFTTVEDIGRVSPTASGITHSFDLRQFGRQQQYGLEFNGYLETQADGYYQFAVESDDGAVLEIDEEVVVENDGNHGPRLVSGHIPLRRGFHKVRLKYFQSEGGATLTVRWGLEGAELVPLEGPLLYH